MSDIEKITQQSPRDVLCVDRSARLRGIEPELEARGWKIMLARDVPDFIRYVRRCEFDLGLLCLDDPAFAEEVLAVDQYIHWIAVVDDRLLTNEDVLKLVSRHFYDYHRFPVDIGRLVTTLGHASGVARLRRLYSEGDVKLTDRLIGESGPMREIKRNVSRVARKHFPVLITGESGTGKELIARAIHEQSDRSAGPFVAVNCGELPDSLIQTELFGHERGPFVGADKRRPGRFEAAYGGTLFLDEIGDMPLEVQANLVRVLEQGGIEKVGDNESRPVDARVVAATNVDLNQAMAGNRFREDLFYRINVPPLRERGDDLLRLAESYLAQFNDDSRPKSFSKRAVAAMCAYTWPGNVRELINRIQQAQISSDSRLILPRHLGLESIGDEHLSVGLTLEDARNNAEKSVLQGALWRNTNNISKAARELAVSRVTLYRLLKKHDLDTANRQQSRQ